MNPLIAPQQSSKYRVGWYWHLGAWLNLVLGSILLVDAFIGDHVASASVVVSCMAAGSLLFFGTTLAFVCYRYSIEIKDRELVYQVRPFINKSYSLEGVKDVRIKGPYLTIDYGQIPRPVIFLLNKNRMSLFYRIAEIAHALPPGTISQYEVDPKNWTGRIDNPTIENRSPCPKNDGSIIPSSKPK